MPCSLCDKLKALFRLGLRMSSPTITIFFPNKARLTARLEAIKVLPSPVVLVSNFYGNIQTILKDFGLLDFFDEIIESSVVGVRKPDPAIYRLGVDAMGFAAENVLVVGDSFSKDVVPAKAVGCRVAWLKGEGWGGEVIDESVPDVIITDLAQLLALL